MSQHIDPVMTQSSVVDNLTTNDGTKALSAKQGKALSDQITTLNGNISSLSEQIAKLNNYDATSSFTAGTGFTIESAVAQQHGTLIFVTIVAVSTATYNVNSPICTVPSGFRPSRNLNSIHVSLKRGTSYYEYSGNSGGSINSRGVVTEGFTSSGQNGDTIVLQFVYTKES